ncbi:FHA domain-containing protein [Synechococcales cyanobacterium C]|uniref:FHA domain-containing protein n=1 Tax=Petrachloros mirabilis ULC683 TaxID=2781853 RepID=A0A8K2A8N9_9CYAN|nr:FHA domain-containing protein [Petrachloros mirabilis ULC683]
MNGSVTPLKLMLTCQNCGHHNLEGSLQCAACFTDLAVGRACPNCSSQVSTVALFCPQCGASLPTPSDTAQATEVINSPNTPQPTEVVTPLKPVPPTDVIFAEVPEVLPLDDIPPLAEPPPLQSLQPQVAELPPISIQAVTPELATPQEDAPVQAIVVHDALAQEALAQSTVAPENELTSDARPPVDLVAADEPQATDDVPNASSMPPSPVSSKTTVQIPASEAAASTIGRTLLQETPARLQHTHTGLWLDLPTHLPKIHFGKPNTLTPPTLDLSGLAHSEVVSRVHAVIHVQPDGFYLEDLGSSNGTYVNNTLLPAGNRYRLRSGDRIAFGKEDRVSFLFDMG